MRAARIALTFLGSVAAGVILTLGPPPTAGTYDPPPPISTNGKDWTAPNGPGR